MIPIHNPITKAMAAKLISVRRNVPIDETIAGLFGRSPRVEKLGGILQRSAVSPHDTGDLSQTSLREFLKDLIPVSIYAALSAQGTSLNFEGDTTIGLPYRNGGDLAASFVGEGGAIPVKRMTLGAHNLDRHKVSVISPFSNEVLALNLAGIIQYEILKDTGQSLDAGLVDDSAAIAGLRPAGLLNGITPTVSAGDTAADIITDLKVLLAAMVANSHVPRPVLILHPNRLAGLSTATTPDGGLLFPFLSTATLPETPIIVSPNIAEDIVVMVDAASFIAANDLPSFTLGTEATLTMADADDTAPTQADDGAGAIGTPEQVLPAEGIHVHEAATVANAGYEAVSLFQTASAATRMILPTGWGMIRSGGVSAISAVSW